MKRILITSIAMSIGIFLFTACDTRQSMMENHGVHSWGMGWGMWVIPILIIVALLYFLRFRRRK